MISDTEGEDEGDLEVLNLPVVPEHQAEVIIEEGYVGMFYWAYTVCSVPMVINTIAQPRTQGHLFPPFSFYLPSWPSSLQMSLGTRLPIAKCNFILSKII